MRNAPGHAHTPAPVSPEAKLARPTNDRAAEPRKRRRKTYAPDAEIDRIVRKIKALGLTPSSVTVHADGSVTVAETAIRVNPEPEETAYDRRQKRKAAQNLAR